MPAAPAAKSASWQPKLQPLFLVFSQTPHFQFQTRPYMSDKKMGSPYPRYEKVSRRYILGPC